MKIKVFVLFLFVLFLCLFLKEEAHAETYVSYEEIVFENDVKLMDTWSEYQKMALAKKCSDKAFGWSIYYKYQKEYFTFIAETLYHVSNLGSEDIVHTFKYEESSESTIQRNVTGTLEIDSSYDNQKVKEEKFKFGLEGKLEYEYKESIKNKVTETDTVKITVAPNSELFIKVMGKGYLSQGYAKKFFFWIKTKDGGFEYVVITTEYFSIDMVTIGEVKDEEVSSD